MNFGELREKFAKRHLDTRTQWIASGDDNKEAINDGYKEVYNKVRQDRSIQEILKSNKTLVNVVSGVGNMPVDFLQPVNIFFKSGGVYSEIDREEFPFRYIREGGLYKVIFEQNPNFSVYVEYIKKIDSLDNDLDSPVLSDDFDMDIINYALVEYHRSQRDWAEVSNELQYAEGKVKETMDNFWLE